MKIQYAVISSFMGQLRDRFHTYGEPDDIRERIRAIASVPNVDGIELVYPQDFATASVEEVGAAVRDAGLGISAVNLNVKGDSEYRDGSFTHTDERVRRRAIAGMREVLDIAAALGASTITCAPLNDGYDYPFEVDYAEAWERLIDGVRQGAQHRTDVRTSVEYKRSEPRARVVLGTAAKSLLLCHEVGLEHVGVTMDMGHALYAGEASAEAAALLHRAGRLFLIHVNDNYRDWDWDLIPGSVNFWDLVELMAYLERYEYAGWFTADVFPARIDRKAAFATSYRMMEAALAIATRLGQERLADLRSTHDVAGTFDALLESLRS